ncbi:hypothetical protein MTR_0021s0120 [Medicago truncatula]|uniref:Uncharacterized protein n=1 Tax=Medicago truncatula TaxID=3880 RepID=A0A072TUX5_MEDTR|nr:hypothetical protein MTR_0021s0120 [Medicago truncatula]
MGGGAWPFLVGGAICLVNSVNERDLSLLNSYVEIIAIVGLQRGIPSKRESSARVDYVPALCTHRPSLLPIEWSGEVFGLRRRGRFAARDVVRIQHVNQFEYIWVGLRCSAPRLTSGSEEGDESGEASSAAHRAQVPWKGASERVRAPLCSDPVAPRGSVGESGCLGMQPQSGGKFRPRLNIGESPIAVTPRFPNVKISFI